MNRIELITLCMSRLEELRCDYCTYETIVQRPYNDRWNNMWGELEWQEELHRLIWMETNANGT